MVIYGALALFASLALTIYFYSGRRRRRMPCPPGATSSNCSDAPSALNKETLMPEEQKVTLTALNVDIEKLRQGGLLIVRLWSDARLVHIERINRLIREWLEANGLPNLHYIVLAPDVEISHLDEQAMNNLGWFRRTRKRRRRRHHHRTH